MKSFILSNEEGGVKSLLFILSNDEKGCLSRGNLYSLVQFWVSAVLDCLTFCHRFFGFRCTKS